MMNHEASQAGRYDPAFILENQNTSAGPDPSQLWRTPSPQVFSGGVSALPQHPEAQLEQAGSSGWQRKFDSSRRDSSGSARYDPNPSVLSGTREWGSGFVQPPRYNTIDSNSSYSTNHSQQSTMHWTPDPSFESPGGYSTQTYFTGAGSHNGFDTPMFSPFLYNQSGSPAHATGNPMGQTNSCFPPFSNYQQDPARQEQQSFSRPQSHELYPSSNIDDIEPLPFHQLVNHNGSLDVIEGHQNPGPYGCDLCEISFGRETDLKRHKDTAKKHGPASGPACGDPSCKHAKPFTRIDNFRTHYRKQHGKTDQEVYEFIEEWRAQERAKGSVGDGGRATVRRRGSAVAKSSGAL